MPLRKRRLFGEEGGLFFCTTNFHKQRRLLLGDKYYRIILESLRFLKQKYNFEVIAYVVMSSHVHLILFVKKGTTLSNIMHDFKKFTAYKIRKQLEEDKEFALLNSLRIERCQEVTPDTTELSLPSGGNSRRKGQKFKIWEDRFDDLYLNQEKTFWVKFNYIHNNPVKAELVKQPEDYPYSSARNYFLKTKDGILEVDIDLMSGGNS